MKRFMIAVLILFTSTAAQAFDFSKFSGCTDIKGRTTTTMVGGTPNIGSAFIDPYHGPVILFDWQTSKTAPDNVLEFVYLHECGHHKLGHALIPPRRGFNPVGDMDEINADCWAKEEYIRRHGEKAFDQMLEDALPINGVWRNNRIQRNCVQ